MGGKKGEWQGRKWSVRVCVCVCVCVCVNIGGGKSHPRNTVLGIKPRHLLGVMEFR